MNHASVVPRDLSYHLLKEITDGFSENRKLGSGAYGKVYMGVHKDGEKIAVKVLYDMPGLDDNDQQFQKEFNNLRSLQHQNIVQLVGYCYETRRICTEYNGRLVLAEMTDRALCFEYMHNGSLDKYLYDEYNGHDWHTRYAIIKGICMGLKYLHEELKPPIYHLDLKPANVLLDQNMIPKIADFGLSRLFGEEQTRISTSSIGTLGYLPPEYIERNVISNKLDIFSLGVVIIKIMTGPTGYSTSAEMSSQEFVELVHGNWRNRLEATSVYAPETYSEQVKRCIEIALSCVEADRHRRPSIGDIVNKLNETEMLRSDLGSSMDQAEREIQKGPNENLQGFLDAIDQLRSIEHFYSSDRSCSSNDGVLSHANELLSEALVKMEGEFQKQLSQCSKPLEPDHLFNCLPSALRPSSESPEGGENQSAGSQSENQQKSEASVYIPPALIEPKFIALLAKLAQQLVQAGCQQKCSEIYSEVRASALESSLKNLGVEKLSKEEVQEMPWEILESNIVNWINFMRISVKLLFAGERQLCDQVFEWSQSFTDKCFAAITQNSLATLLSFGEATAMCTISPEKLFVLLDMFEIMRELQIEIDTIFVGESCSQMRESALSLTKCLAQTVLKTFGVFEEIVEKDATIMPTDDGMVHSLTYYVINYVIFLFDYQSTLEQLFQEFRREDGTGFELAAVTMSILQALQNNLNVKAKQYQDPALMHIFLMNNIHYILKSLRRSGASDLLGGDWIQRHRRIVQQNANQYKRLAWSKVLQCLSHQGFSSSEPSIAAVKERFRSFNMLFEEIYQKQCGWLVPDSELRESLRLAVAEVLLPAYKSFLKRFGPLIGNSKSPGKYIKYTPEQLEQYVGNLFEGKQEHLPVPVAHSPVISGMRKLMPFLQKRNQ